MTVTIQHVDTKLLNAIESLLKLSPKAKLKKDQADEELLEAIKEVEEKRKNGTLKTYKNLEEYQRAMNV